MRRARCILISAATSRAAASQVYGFPYAVVDGTTPLRTVQFQYSDESDGVDHTTNRSVPFYPIPDEAITQAHWIEGGEPGNVDFAVRAIAHAHRQSDHRYLYSYTTCFTMARSGRRALARFRFEQERATSDGWTSADAGGLAILPGLIRYDEAFGAGKSGMRSASPCVDRMDIVYPASHRAGSTTARCRWARGCDEGARNLSGFTPEVQRISRDAAIRADRRGQRVGHVHERHLDTRWDNGILNPAFRALTASDFEVITLDYAPSKFPPRRRNVRIVG